MKKIAITVSNLSQGGITTALVSLLNELIKYNSYDITLFVLGTRNSSRHTIPDGINIIHPSKMLDYWCSPPADIKGINLFIYKLIHYIGNRTHYRPWYWFACYGKKYKGFDVAISYENDIAKPNIIFMCNDFVLNRICARRKLTWIHNDPIRLGYTNEYAHKRYSRFNGIVSVSEGNKNKFDGICPEYVDRSHLVYNCINLADIVKTDCKYSEIDGKFHIISVSRLANEQKRIDRMIDTCVELKKRGFSDSFIWHMFGSGPDEKYLKEYATKKDVNDVFFFEGFSKNTLLEMAKCDLYVMTSDYEGYGLTISEALCENIPVLCTNFSEARESIENGKNGIITGFDPREIATVIISLLSDKKRLLDMRKYVTDHPVNNNLAIMQFFKVVNSLL